jgi:hypothetical protein
MKAGKEASKLQNLWQLLVEQTPVNFSPENSKDLDPRGKKIILQEFQRSRTLRNFLFENSKDRDP